MTGESEWAARIREWRRSGVSAAAFCKSQPYSAATLYWWSSYLRKSGQAAEPDTRPLLGGAAAESVGAAPGPMRLARVVREDPAVCSEPATPVIVHLGQLRVEVTSAVDRGALSTVLELLASLGVDR